MWRGQIDYFSKKKYRVIACDARGHGKSDAPDTGYSRSDRVQDLLNLVNVLNLGKFHLVGLSMGGGDALSFAIDYHERLLSLTLAGTAASGWKAKVQFRNFPLDENGKYGRLNPGDLARQKGIDEVKRQWIQVTMANYEKQYPELKEILTEIMSDFSGKPWLDRMVGKYPKRDDLNFAPKIRIPALIIVGQRDIIFRPLSIKLHEVILDSRLEIVKNTGHMVNMEAPDVFNQNLEKFLFEND
jgi:pimeloyl-ACP methyl ester carboxylesterase